MSVPTPASAQSVRDSKKDPDAAARGEHARNRPKRPSAVASDQAEQLRVQIARLDETQRLAHLGSWEWDVANDEVRWTPELYRLYGLEPDSRDVDYAFYLSCIHPDDRERVDGVVKACFKDGDSFDFEHRLVQPDGTVKWLHGRGGVDRGPDGFPTRMFGTALDITQRKESAEALQRSVDEKEALLRELHHRVKNNLQVIASLLNLQAGELADQAARGHLLESRDRVRSMALVHETLYRSKELSRVDFRGYLERLLADLQRSHGDASGRIRLEFAVDEVEMEVAEAMHAGLLVNELVSNAFKHAFPDDRAGRVQVRLRRGAEGGVVLEVNDDGIGIPKGASKRPGSLGLRLVETFAQQLGGALERNDGPPGARFRVVLPPHVAALAGTGEGHA